MHNLLYGLHGFPKSPRSSREGRYVLQASYDEQIAKVLDEVRGQTVDQAKEWLG